MAAHVVHGDDGGNRHGSTVRLRDADPVGGCCNDRRRSRRCRDRPSCRDRPTPVDARPGNATGQATRPAMQHDRSGNAIAQATRSAGQRRRTPAIERRSIGPTYRPGVAAPTLHLASACRAEATAEPAAVVHRSGRRHVSVDSCVDTGCQAIERHLDRTAPTKREQTARRNLISGGSKASSTYRTRDENVRPSVPSCSCPPRRGGGWGERA